MTPLRRLAGADRLGGERRAGVEQGLAAAGGLVRELGLLERQVAAKQGWASARATKAAVRGQRAGVELEAGIGGVAEEAGDGDVGEADLAEQEAVGGKLAFEIVERGAAASSARVFSIRAWSPGSPQTIGWTTFW